MASGGCSLTGCAGFLPQRPPPVWSIGSGVHRLLLSSSRLYSAGSKVVARGPRCSAACGFFPDQGANPSLLHWQADSLPVSHERSPLAFLREVFHMIKIGYCQKVAASLRWSILLCSLPQSLLLLFLTPRPKCQFCHTGLTISKIN